MALSEKIITEAGLLGIWEISESSDDLFSIFKFSETEKNEFSKIKAERRKTEYLAVRLLLQELLNKKQEIQYQQSGKPELKSIKKNISISHSSNFIVILLSDKKIGIDVEVAQRDIEKVATRFLHKNELKQIHNESNQQLAKILYWSAKEAIFKCTDEQHIEFRDHIFIDPFTIEKEGKFTGTLNKKVRYNLCYLLYQNNVIVYCVE